MQPESLVLDGPVERDSKLEAPLLTFLENAIRFAKIIQHIGSKSVNGMFVMFAVHATKIIIKWKIAHYGAYIVSLIGPRNVNLTLVADAVTAVTTVIQLRVCYKL